tara:strand:+ start:73 stop:813 length:741 start_codon:yes stop_codon:yes gene_type:complete
MIGSLGRPALHLGRRLFDLVLPPRCKKCGALVTDDDGLCAECWSGLSFLGPPWCTCCGLPFDYDVGAGAVCGACVAAPPVFSTARSALAYDDASRELILRFKHGGDETLSRLFARWMMLVGEGLMEEPSLIVPVPLHPWRRIRRRFNQSALLAADLARLTGLQSDPLSLIRVKRTPSQGGLGKAARKVNVQGAFTIDPDRRTRIVGQSILLIDDVWTSGATAEACIRACRKAGSGPVSLLTVARVL